MEIDLRLIKDLLKAVEPLEERAASWRLNTDTARISVRLGHLRRMGAAAARLRAAMEGGDG